MRWSSDRSKFPMVELPDEKLAVHLLPVSKLQFERFLAEPVVDLQQASPMYGDGWYESLLAVLPRVTLVDASVETYESQFLGGVLPNEVDGFARWLGKGFELPRVESWRKIDDVLNEEPLTDTDAEALMNDERLCRSARSLLAWWISARQPRTWGELAGLHGGLLEWVKIGPKSFGGLGRPRHGFRSILINPQRDEPVRPIQQRRLAYFGFRLIVPL